MSEELIDSATRWYVLLRSGQATAGDWQGYEHWRAADPRHAPSRSRTRKRLP